MPFYDLIAHVFLALINIPLYERTTIYPSPTEGHLWLLPTLGILNKATINISVQIFV